MKPKQSKRKVATSDHPNFSVLGVTALMPQLSCSVVGEVRIMVETPLAQRVSVELSTGGVVCWLCISPNTKGKGEKEEED